jgi:hypothetical protein
MRWLPPLVFASLMVVQRVLTHVHPPHPASAGAAGQPRHLPVGWHRSARSCSTGLIAYLLWREFSGSRRAAIWAAAVVAALGFHEA